MKLQRALVIGYGNDLLGDDAAGPLVARKIQDLDLSGVEVRICRQLTPELAGDLARVERVVFIDAREGGESLAEARPVGVKARSTFSGHYLEPGVLLGLSSDFFGRAPEAWMVTIAARSFHLGAPPTADCAAGMARAAVIVRGLCVPAAALE